MTVVIRALSELYVKRRNKQLLYFLVYNAHLDSRKALKGPHFTREITVYAYLSRA